MTAVVTAGFPRVLRHPFLIAVAILGAFNVAVGQVPPGYRIVQLTEGSEFDWWATMNNVGQVAFIRRFDPYDDRTDEIFVCDVRARQLTRVTNDNLRDAGPDINDAGVVVWSRAVGPPGPYGSTMEIFRWENGVTRRVTNDGVDDWGPSINQHGRIVWSKRDDQGCGRSGNIWSYDGETAIQITSGTDWTHQAARINDVGEIAWTRADFCVWPWTSDVLLYSNGKITQVSPEDAEEPQGVLLNNAGQVGWSVDNDNPCDGSIQIWHDGVVTTITDRGGASGLNDHGDVSFVRHVGSDVAQVWLYSEGQLFQITNDPFPNYGGDLNNSGEMVWESGGYPLGDIRYLERLPLGDLNCDGSVNGFDIQPFILALSDPEGYSIEFPRCDSLLADTSADGSVNQFDIQSFVDLLSR